MANWMIYGATGYTGHLLVAEAVARGHRPILAGRSPEKLAWLAEEYDGLQTVTFGVNSAYEAAAGLQEADVELVLHAAGPFIHTSDPMIQACLSLGIDYLDITGEIPVFENTFSYHDDAAASGITLMSGVGFDIVPSDCLCRYVAEQVNEPTNLTVALSALSASRSEVGISAGTMKSMLEMIPGGGYLRRDGELTRVDFGHGQRTFQFPQGERLAMVIPWGDISTAYRTTGADHITTYMVLPLEQIRIAQVMGGLLQNMIKIRPVRRWMGAQIDRFVKGPSADMRRTARSYQYAEAIGRDGSRAEAWLETEEAYQFTAKSALACVERVLDGNYPGAQTPAGAFGADFVLSIGNTLRFDQLPTNISQGTSTNA